MAVTLEGPADGGENAVAPSLTGCDWGWADEAEILGRRIERRAGTRELVLTRDAAVMVNRLLTYEGRVTESAMRIVRETGRRRRYQVDQGLFPAQSAAADCSAARLFQGMLKGRIR